MEFTAHNIRFPDGSYSISESQAEVDHNPWTESAVRLFKAIYGSSIDQKSVADMGCLEGGTTVALARTGMRGVGIEVRKSNFENCLYVKDKVGLKNLDFYNDDVWNLAKYGPYDSIFCSGLLYHLDRPVEFLKLMSENVRDAVVINTHFAPEHDTGEFDLSEMTENEGFPGRWYAEHDVDDKSILETYKWASWENKKSFWLTKPALIQAMMDAGFDIVSENFDFLGKAPLSSMSGGWYSKNSRSTFVGIKVK